MADEKKKGGMDLKPWFQKIAENEKYRRILLLIGMIGIALIFLSGYFKSDSAEDTNLPTTSSQITSEQYAEDLERRLEEIVNGITGGNNAKVLITLEKGVQQVYATEEKKSTQTTQDQGGNSSTKSQENNSLETKYILVKDADGSQQALAVTEIQPTVKGVIVVCENGDNPVLQQNVTNAVTTALNISSARVCVVKEN